MKRVLEKAKRGDIVIYSDGAEGEVKYIACGDISPDDDYFYCSYPFHEIYIRFNVDGKEGTGKVSIVKLLSR